MVNATWKSEKVRQLSGALKRYGGIGFWVQLVFLIVVLLLGIYTLSVNSGDGNRATLANLLSFLVLGMPVFTTIWCRRYANHGRALSESTGPTPSSLKRQLWTGIWAGTIGAAASLFSLFGAASALLFTMLANPQIGVQVSPATGTAAPYTISAIDAVSIMSLVLTLTAELLVVLISLRLLFLATAASETPTSS